MEKFSVTGNRTLVSRVTGGDTSHYTMTDLVDDSCPYVNINQRAVCNFLNDWSSSVSLTHFVHVMHFCAAEMSEDIMECTKTYLKR